MASPDGGLVLIGHKKIGRIWMTHTGRTFCSVDVPAGAMPVWDEMSVLDDTEIVSAPVCQQGRHPKPRGWLKM